MKHRLAFGLVLLGFILLAGLALVNAQPAGDLPTVTPSMSRVIRPDIYVRGGPGEFHLPVGQLTEGAFLLPLSRNAAGDWVLIQYYSGFGWVRRDLGFWVEDIDELPVMDERTLTPSPVPGRETATPFVPTETPSANWVDVIDGGGAFVRAGPGRTYLRLGTLFTGDIIDEPLGRDEEAAWVMFRYEGGFGWIAASIVRWQDDLEPLPVLSEDALTPTATDTATSTPTPTNTPTDTPTPTLTATPTVTPSSTLTSTATSTATDTPSPTATATSTDTPTSTPTLTATATDEPTSTATSTATDTSTPTATATDEPTSTATSTATDTTTPTATATDEPTSTATSRATDTTTPTLTATPTTTPTPTAEVTDTPVVAAIIATSTPINTPTPTYTPTVTVTPTPTLTITPSPTDTPTLTPTMTATPSVTVTDTPPATPTLTATVTDTPSPTHTVTPSPTATVTPIPPSPTVPTATPSLTETPVAAVVQPTIMPTADLTPQVVDPEPGERFPIEAAVGGVLLLGILGYVGLYLRGAAALERYAAGFVVEVCPVCQRGQLLMDARQERRFGIPQARRIVRCSECRSVLRETGTRRWRYAVDPLANPVIYQRYNGQEIDDESLAALAQNPPQPAPAPRPPVKPPAFVDDDED